jgi:hypothetical protein
MGVRIIGGDDSAALYDSTSGVAFGPVFADVGKAQAFLDHLASIGERDPRVIPVGELVELADEWKDEQEDED